MTREQEKTREKRNDNDKKNTQVFRVSLDIAKTMRLIDGLPMFNVFKSKVFRQKQHCNFALICCHIRFTVHSSSTIDSQNSAMAVFVTFHSHLSRHIFCSSLCVYVCEMLNVQCFYGSINLRQRYTDSSSSILNGAVSNIHFQTIFNFFWYHIPLFSITFQRQFQCAIE